MSEIITERSGSILRVQLNRPAKKNAMTSNMYVTVADLLNSSTSISHWSQPYMAQLSGRNQHADALRLRLRG